MIKFPNYLWDKITNYRNYIINMEKLVNAKKYPKWSPGACAIDYMRSCRIYNSINNYYFALNYADSEFLNKYDVNTLIRINPNTIPYTYKNGKRLKTNFYGKMKYFPIPYSKTIKYDYNDDNEIPLNFIDYK
tara:strand:- start:2292 stop:2687 length:396 start_codon:yes stop_codon:yes gene_type:complete